MKFYQKKKYFLAINGVSPLFVTQIVKAFCIKNEIPVIGWQHGANWLETRITQRIDYEDLLFNTIILTYGEGCRQAYAATKLKTSCKVIPVGSASLDEISKSNDKNNDRSYLRLLYVITNYWHNGWYCGFSPPVSDRFYFLEQRIIIDRLKDISGQIKNFKITIKLFPGKGELFGDPPWVTELKQNENFNLIRQPEFVQLLKDNDAVLIDSPTTTLLQAISTSLPVFVLTSIISPPYSDLQKLEKRAVCADKAYDLMDSLEKYVKNGVYPGDVNNREYLKLYGTYSDDGRSSERALNLIRGIVIN